MLGAHRCFYKLSFSFYFTTHEFFSWASNSLLLLFLADRDVRAQSVVGMPVFFFSFCITCRASQLLLFGENCSKGGCQEAHETHTLVLNSGVR